MTAGSWVADPTLAWVIALHVRLREQVTAERVTSGLASTGLGASLTSLNPSSHTAMLDEVIRAGPEPLRAAVSGRELALGAEHQYCDGLGLLALLGTALDLTATSSARGVGAKSSQEGPLVTALRRLREAALTPPASVATMGMPRKSSAVKHGDTFVRFAVAGRVPVAELTRAAVAAVATHNRELGARDTRIAVAVGASRVGGSAPSLADQSALLRLREVERLSGDALRDAIRSAVPETPPPGSRGGSRVVAIAATTAMGALSSRLGSTLLISHLGEVHAPGVDELAFYPVTGGGSGVSIGAAGLRGTTLVTLRGRRHRHPPFVLEALGRRVRDELTSAMS